MMCRLYAGGTSVVRRLYVGGAFVVHGWCIGDT